MTKNGLNDVAGRVRMRHCVGENRRNERASKVNSMIELFSNGSPSEEFVRGSPKPNVRRITTFLENHREFIPVERERRKPGAILTTDNVFPQPVKRRTSPLSISSRTPKPYSGPSTVVLKRPVSLAVVNETSDKGSPVIDLQPKRATAYTSKPISANATEVKQAESAQTNIIQRRLQALAIPEKALPNHTGRPGDMASGRLKNGSLPSKCDSSSSSSITSDVTHVDEMSPANHKIRHTRDYWEHKIEPKAGMEKPSHYKSETNLASNKRRPTSVSSENAFSSNFKSTATVRDSPRLRLKSAEYNSSGCAAKVSSTAYREHASSSVADLVRNFSIRPDDRSNPDPAKSTVKTRAGDKQPRPRLLTTVPALSNDRLLDNQASSQPFVLKPNVSPTSLRRPVSPLATSSSSNRPIPLPRSNPQIDSKTTNGDQQQRNDAVNHRIVNPLPKPARTFTFAATDLTAPVRQRPRRTVARDSSGSSNDYDVLATSSNPDLRSPSPNYFSRFPKEGYEQVSLFEYSDSRSRSMISPQSKQTWQRQHNYEQVDHSEDLENISRPAYDRIELSKSPQPQIDHDSYSHLTFKQDLLTTETDDYGYLDEQSRLALKLFRIWQGPVSKNKPLSLKVSPRLQHMKLRKLNSDMSDIKSRSCDDLTRTEKTAESGLMQVTDKIRDIFSQFGKKYKHRKTTAEDDSEEMSPRSSADEDSDTETDFSKHRQTLDRVRTYQKNYRKTLKYKSLERELSKSAESTIFEQALICKIIIDQSGQKSSKVSYRFPAPPPGKSLGDETTLAHFCFPDIDAMVPCEKMLSDSYSFMLTREDGSRKFGYCRRILPPGDGPRYPVVYCLISPLGSFGLYESILDELEQKHRIGLKRVQRFLETIFIERFPAPGRSVIIEIEDTEGKSNFVLRRPYDTRLEHVDLQCLISEMGVDNTIKVFASLLLERRVIISGKSLSTLTACIHALRALLYPFVWQHVFIPVLPPPMIELCCSPTPLLVGILETSLDKLKTLPLEEVLIINLPTLEVVSSMGDELEILPRKLQAPLMNTLAQFASNGRGNTSQPTYDFALDYESAERNTVISESFMHLFVEMIGHYQNHFQNAVPHSQATRFGKMQRTFNRDSFYEDVTSRSLLRFLDMFMGTQMFDGFIHSRELSNPDYEGLFERRIANHLRNVDASQLNFKVFKSKMRKFVFGIGKKK